MLRTRAEREEREKRQQEQRQRQFQHQHDHAAAMRAQVHDMMVSSIGTEKAMRAGTASEVRTHWAHTAGCTRYR